MNGLNITLSEFKSMNQKKQLEVLFCNTETIKKQVISYKLHQKIQYGCISALTGGVLFITKILIS